MAGGHAATHQEVTLGVQYRTPDEQAFSWNQELGGAAQLSSCTYAGECQPVHPLRLTFQLCFKYKKRP